MALSVVSVTGSNAADSPPLALFPIRQIWTLALNSQISVAPAYDSERVFFSLDGDRLVAPMAQLGQEAVPVPGGATGAGNQNVGSHGAILAPASRPVLL